MTQPLSRPSYTPGKVPTLPSCPTPFSDHIYATKHGVDLPLRLFPSTSVSASASSSSDSSSASAANPYIIWIHGGAFTFGRHTLPNPWVVRSFRPLGYHVVSIAYRLCPHVSLADMVADCTDAIAWCRTHLPGLVGTVGAGVGVDVDRFVVAGDSAGGCLSALLAHKLSPAPRALIDVYGPTDLCDIHFDSSAPEINAEIEPLSGEFPEDEVIRGCRPGPFARPRSLPEPLPAGVHPPRAGPAGERRPDIAIHERRVRFQCDMKRYMGTNKILFRTILHAKDDWTQEQYMAHAKKWSPLWLLDGKKTYPPTYLIHGEEDVLVPLNHSTRMAHKLREMGVDVGEWYEHGGHVFDIKYSVSAETSRIASRHIASHRRGHWHQQPR
jgi:acetyl esterase/lipase